MKINRNDIKKVINLLNKVGELSIEKTIENLGFNKSKVESIFSILIENEDVIDLSSKTGMSIAKKRISNYKSLSSNTPKPSSKINKLAKNPFIQIITIFVLFYTFLKIIEAIFNINIPKI